MATARLFRPGFSGVNLQRQTSALLACGGGIALLLYLLRQARVDVGVPTYLAIVLVPTALVTGYYYLRTARLELRVGEVRLAYRGYAPADDWDVALADVVLVRLQPLYVVHGEGSRARRRLIAGELVFLGTDGSSRRVADSKWRDAEAVLQHLATSGRVTERVEAAV
jgi:hypothetical protein